MLTGCIMCMGRTEADHSTMGEITTISECNGWTPAMKVLIVESETTMPFKFSPLQGLRRDL